MAISNQQIIEFLALNPNITGQELATAMDTYKVDASQIASALSENAQKGGYQTTTIPNMETGQAVSDIRDLGAGFNAYQDESGQTSGFSRVDPSRPEMIQMYGPNGEYRGEQKITTTTQDLISNLGPIVLAAGGTALAQGLLGGSLLGSGAATVGTTGMTMAELAQLDLALGGAGGTAGATSLANALTTGALTGTLTNLTGGSGTGTLVGTGVGTGTGIGTGVGGEVVTGTTVGTGVGTGLGTGVGTGIGTGVGTALNTGLGGLTTAQLITLLTGGLGLAAANAATKTNTPTGFDIVPIPTDWKTPDKPTTAPYTALSPINFGTQNLLRDTQFEKFLDPNYGQVPKPVQYSQPSSLSYNDLMGILGSKQGMPSASSLSVNDIISGIQNQYGQANSSAMG